MDVFDAIAKRHSYRGPFRDQPVPRDVLKTIVQAGIQAPSGYNGQSTSFIIVDDPETIAKMGEITGNNAIKAAPAAIVIVADPGATADKDYSFFVEDYAAAVENILLAVTALGFASVWIDGVLRSEGRAEKLGELLDVPPERAVRVVLPIGVPAEMKDQTPKKPFSERAWFDRWGQT